MNFLKVIKDIKVRKKEAPAQKLIGYAREADVRALFTLLGLLAKSEGRVTKSQIREVQKFINLHVPSNLHDFAKQSFRRGKETNLVHGAIVKHAFTLYWSGSKSWLEPLQVLDMLIRVAFVDGSYSSQEQYVVEVARKSLKIHVRIYWCLRDQLAGSYRIDTGSDLKDFASAPDLEALRKRKQQYYRSDYSEETEVSVEERESSRDRAFKVLELEPEATEEEIKLAYRTLVKMYHPDKLKAIATTEDECRKAVEKFCEVQDAYELLLEAI